MPPRTRCEPMRLGERENGAKAAAVEAPEQKREARLPLCVCGCGRSVQKLGHRYIVGHKSEGWHYFPPEVVEASLAQQCLTACALCNWRFEGSVREGHQAFLAHLAAQHPQRVASEDLQRRGGRGRRR
jgi:hypothetical protein